ncbi:hypothetical protein EI94DRAFT_1723843 [Lactarius quietus]|nr:hypothetical protein EI94DRAFT_1723843 [Lactarius quietus]
MSIRTLDEWKCSQRTPFHQDHWQVYCPNLFVMSRTRTDVAYEPPSTVKSLHDRRLAIYRSSTVLAWRFAVLEVHLIPFVKDGDNSVGNGARDMLVLSTYLALSFCLGVVVSGQILTYWSVEPPAVRPPQERGPSQDGLSDSGTSDRLQGREVKRTWARVCVMWHWAFSLIAGTVSFITQVLLFVWPEELNFVRIVVSIITVFIVLLSSVFLMSSFRKR